MSKSIWHAPLSVSSLNTWCENTIHTSLGIQITEVGSDYLTGSMPVGSRTKQPQGLLHGGASVVLAESLGSIASSMALDSATHQGLGIEINANHLSPVTDGIVTGTCKPIHLGATLHVWGITIVDDKSNLICTARLTVIVRKIA